MLRTWAAEDQARIDAVFATTLPAASEPVAATVETVKVTERSARAGLSTATPTFKDLAQRLIERGIPVIPLLPGTKKAFSNEWPTLATTDPAQVSRWDAEYPTANIGCVGLAKTDGICFFEIDDPALYHRIEQETEQKFPETFRVRSSPGKGHIYFRHTASTIELASRKAYYSLKNSDGSELCSARLNHAYVVGPGSIHPDTRKAYEIVALASVADFPEWLVEWIKKNLANDENKLPVTASSEGPRIPRGSHDNELTRIAGALRAKGLTEEEMLPVLVRNVEERFDEYGSDYVQMCAKVAHSIGKKPAGISSIPLTSNGKTEAEIRQQQSNVPVIEESVPIQLESYPEFPEMSGALWELAKEMFPDIPMSFKFMSLVTHWGLARSGLDALAGQRNFQTRFYTCLVAEPWRGKTAAMNEAHNYLRAIYPPSLLPSDGVDSGPALVGDFEDLRKAHPSAERLMILLHADEMGDLFEKAKSTSQSRNTLGTMWTSLFESNSTSNRARQANKGRRIQIENAHLAILGGTTPDGYEQMWSKTGGGANGMMSRFVSIGTNSGVMPEPPRQSTAEAAIRLKEVIELSQKPQQAVYLEPDVQKILTDWWAQYRKGECPSATRVLDIVKRMILVLAVTNPHEEDLLGDDSHIAVAPELVQQACAFGDYVIRMRELLNPMDSYTFVQAFHQGILKTFDKYSVGKAADGKDRPLGQRDVRRLMSADKKPGGAEYFTRAWDSCIRLGDLVKVGVRVAGNHKNTDVFVKEAA